LVHFEIPKETCSASEDVSQ